MVGGASAVSQDIPPFCLAEGNKAVLRGLNLTGLRRRFDNREDIDAIKHAYRELLNQENLFKKLHKSCLKIMKINM